jgi:hypothetical protein
MSTWRVLWIDAAGDGRWTDVNALSTSDAAWKTAIATESREAVFIECRAIDQKAM